jgi:hypothetical protein
MHSYFRERRLNLARNLLLFETLRHRIAGKPVWSKISNALKGLGFQSSFAIEGFPFLSWSMTQRSLLRYHRRITSIAGFPQGVCERSLSPPNPFVPTFHQYMPSNHGLL